MVYGPWVDLCRQVSIHSEPGTGVIRVTDPIVKNLTSLHRWGNFSPFFFGQGTTTKFIQDKHVFVLILSWRHTSGYADVLISQKDYFIRGLGLGDGDLKCYYETTGPTQDHDHRSGPGHFGRSIRRDRDLWVKRVVSGGTLEDTSKVSVTRNAPVDWKTNRVEVRNT